jgi:hypothetical protein
MKNPFPSRLTRQALAAACAAGLALGATPSAHASTSSDVKALQKAMAEMKADYDRRLAALESQLKEARAAQAPVAPAQVAAPVATPIAAAAPPADVAPPPAPPAPVGAVSGGGAGAFNPAVSLILSGTYAHTTRDPASYRITGVALPSGAEIGPGTRGFSLAESELALSANIDPWLSGSINLSISPDDTISAEEAYVQTTTLPDGLGLKAGRFFSGVGYLNSQHAHTWDFVDNPLAYQAFLGTQLADDGLQLHWLAPTDQYLDFGAELGRGRSFPGGFGNGGTGSNAPGMWALTAHTGGDIGDSSSWRAGLSLLRDRAQDQALDAMGTDGNAVSEAFTGRTRVWVLDGVWKWAPNGNATRTNFKLQGEWLRSERAGGLALGDGAPGPWRSTQQGGYVQAVWQFAPMWRVGLRTERIDLGGDPSGLGPDGYVPRKNSLMFDFSPSEFSRIRLQLARDQARQGAADTQVLLQYQTSLGAHGAHAY